MHRPLLSLVFALVTSLSLSAHAQNPPMSDKDQAPQDRPSRRGRVLETVKDDTMNIRFYPVNLLAALVSVDFDFKIADQWTLGPSLSYWKFKIDKGGSFTNDFQINRYRIGARANWFKNGAFTDGLFFGPSIDYVNIDLSTADSSGPVTAKGAYFSSTLLLGYGWFWDSFNMMLGAGATLGLGSSQVEVRSNSGTNQNVDTTGRGGSLAFDWSLGWTF